jgi:membrane protease YdiL (CAAX protease family)
MRIVLFYFLAIALVAFGGTVIAMSLVPASVPRPTAWLIRAALVMALVLTVTHGFMARARVPWSTFGVTAGRWCRDPAIGAVGGFLLAGAWLVAIDRLSPFELAWNREWAIEPFAAASLGTLAMGIAEEVGYRSFGLSELRRLFGARHRGGYAAAVTISTAVFVAAHVAGGVPWPAAVLVVGSASVLFCVVMLETRSLPLVVALHVVTNLVQDNTLRTDAAASLFTPRASGPAAPDLAIWTTMALINLIAAGALLAWSRRRTKMTPR